MSKLIDADALKALVYEWHARNKEDLCRTDLDAVMMLDNAPEAIVRCKDCKYFIKLQPQYPDWCHNDNVSITDVIPDFFCAAGERREE